MRPDTPPPNKYTVYKGYIQIPLIQNTRKCKLESRSVVTWRGVRKGSRQEGELQRNTGILQGNGFVHSFDCGDGFTQYIPFVNGMYSYVHMSKPKVYSFNMYGNYISINEAVLLKKKKGIVRGQEAANIWGDDMEEAATPHCLSSHCIHDCWIWIPASAFLNSLLQMSALCCVSTWSPIRQKPSTYPIRPSQEKHLLLFSYPKPLPMSLYPNYHIWFTPSHTNLSLTSLHFHNPSCIITSWLLIYFLTPGSLHSTPACFATHRSSYWKPKLLGLIPQAL